MEGDGCLDWTVGSAPAYNSVLCVWSPQKTIFSTGTPVAAATVAPILATNTISSVTTAGKSEALLFLCQGRGARKCRLTVFLSSSQFKEQAEKLPTSPKSFSRICNVFREAIVEEFSFFLPF